MKRYLSNNIRILVVSLGVVALILLFMLAIRHGDNSLDAAYDSYVAGESAKTIDERKKAFNQALNLYLQLEKDYHPTFGNGKLYYNIGNTYFQLGLYSWAIVYYEKAQLLMPRETKVQRNISIAQEKLGLPESTSEGAFNKIFFFHSYLSLPERLQLLEGAAY